jgi:hypothetical protein
MAAYRFVLAPLAAVAALALPPTFPVCGMRSEDELK